MSPRSWTSSRVLASLIFVGLVTASGARASGSIDHFRAGRQSWLEKDWDTAARQFSLALSDSLPFSVRIDALFYRANALARLHECARVAEDVSTLHSLGAAG